MARLPLNLHSYEHGGVTPPRFALIAPAKMLLPWLRYPLGFETVHPWPMLLRLSAISLITPLFWVLWGMLTGSGAPENEGREFLYLVVLATFAVTCLRFMRRAWGQHRGEEIHTAEAGYSCIARWLPLPAALCEQVIVPMALAWLGWLMLVSISVDLGCWLMICSASYFLLSNWERRNQLAQRRAPVDDKLRAQGFVETIDRHEQKQVKRSKRKETHDDLYPEAEQPDIAELGSKKRW